ncbi:MAG TPA: hemolysin family protein [Actinomycetota bacterium]|nr:hemolysin family protein [Actinomycetota bacterium]
MNTGYLIASVLLLLANGFFVAAEFGLIAARRTRIEELAASGRPSAIAALKSLRELSFMLAGAQLGITMASLGLGFVAEPAIASIIESTLHDVASLPPAALHSVSLVVALTVVVFLHMVVGEMAPKNIAISEPERVALWLAIPMRGYANLFRPFLRLLNASANGILRLIGIEPRDELLVVHTAGEIGRMVSESAREGLVDPFNERLLKGIIDLGERDAVEAMVPRTDLTAVSATSTPEEVEAVAVESGHSRIPVYRDDLDHILGFVHVKDLLRIPPDERTEPVPPRFVRQMLVVPESRKLRSLLLEMRRGRRHAALVVDEHGGTAGIVTLEDLVEELVGDIRDEYDVGELGIEQLGENRYLVPGGLRIDEAATRLGVVLPEGEYETIAGFLMDRLGRIPRRRDTIEHDGWKLRVRNMYRRRVVQVLVERGVAERRESGTPGATGRTL